MSDTPSPIGRIEGVRPQEAAASRTAALQSIQRESASEEFQEWGDLAAFNPLAISRRFTPLLQKTRKEGEEEKKVAKEEKKITEIRRIESLADQFARRNPEFNVRALLALRNRLGKEDSKEEILEKTRASYHDASLADEALDFLIESSDGELAQTIREAKEAFNKEFAREIKAGRNIATQARDFSAQGLGTPTSLRDIYREITRNPRDAATLFEFLSTQFSFEKLKTVIGFVLHSLGSDLKAAGPSISRAELHRLVTESRSLSAILGVYLFFRTRSRLIEEAFKRGQLGLPSSLSFDLLARLFVRFLQERYPNTEKLLQMAKEMGIEDEILAEIIIFTQMRDAIRQVAPRLFRSEQHRQDILKLYLEALNALEDELDEEEEKEEEEEK